MEKKEEEIDYDDSLITIIMRACRFCTLSYFLDSSNNVYQMEFYCSCKIADSLSIINIIKERFFVLSTKSKEFSADAMLATIFSSRDCEARVLHQTIKKLVPNGSKVERVDSGDGSIDIKIYSPVAINRSFVNKGLFSFKHRVPE